MVWGSMCVVGWFSAVALFLDVGSVYPRESILLALTVVPSTSGRWYPLRGLGLSEVVGLSVAFDIRS